MLKRGQTIIELLLIFLIVVLGLFYIYVDFSEKFPKMDWNLLKIVITHSATAQITYLNNSSIQELSILCDSYDYLCLNSTEIQCGTCKNPVYSKMWIIDNFSNLKEVSLLIEK